MDFINLTNIIIVISVYFFLLIVLYFNKNLFTVSFGFQAIVLLFTVLIFTFIVLLVYYLIDYYYGDVNKKINTSEEEEYRYIPPPPPKPTQQKIIPNLKPLTSNISNISNNNMEKYNKPEVFHIHNNIFTYEDAKDVCKSYGAQLATLDQIKEAYNNGADWCNYGWSQNNTAYYPTQQKTYDEMQKDPKTKFNCGKPGINGGYFDNPKLRFGINCYGVKPEGMSKSYPKDVKKNGSSSSESEEDVPKKDWSKIHKDLQISGWDNYKWSNYSNPKSSTC
jgi:hypothetical protein